MNLQQKNKTCVRVLNESTAARIRAVVLFCCQAYDKKVRWTFRLPVLEQPKVHYAQKIEMMYEQLIKNIKR
ncbi:hypothetical protein DXD50_05750 [Dorea formicigenerans]|nr:hypothetical protein DXD50_05750 [Dorea formicigenerans]